jgi:isoquinoline 1-oxidoreductase
MRPTTEGFEPERYELDEEPRYTFTLTRRAFVQTVATGLVISWQLSGAPALAQRPGRASGGSSDLRFHFGKDGTVTAMTGKVEVGQGARTQLTQAVAEELRLPMANIQLVMADTTDGPNDGGTYGSRTTPSTVPAVRKAAAEAREVLIQLAAENWGVSPSAVQLKDGVFSSNGKKKLSLAEIAKDSGDLNRLLKEDAPSASSLVTQTDWQVLGLSPENVNGENVVTGKHQYPSDIRRPGMLYGKVLRPATYNAELESVDLNVVKDMKDVVVVHDASFVACAASTTFRAAEAIKRLDGTARWSKPDHPSSKTLSAYLKEHATSGSGRRRSRDQETGDVDGALAKAAQVEELSFDIPYIQHAPLEPRAAVAEWEGDYLTVWTGTQNPFGVRGELASAFKFPPSKITVRVPDTGGGFGGKHTGDAAIEAARLAKEAGKPVSVQWTREEEFTWAYFRPAGLIEVESGIDKSGAVSAFAFTNYNSGGSGLSCPYDFPNIRTSFKYCDSPLREGSYRALASTANHFAREVAIDHLASVTSTDPLAFRLKNLKEKRQKDVLAAAAEKFGWDKRKSSDSVGMGLACGTEKAGFVATCAEVDVNAAGRFEIKRLVVAFECGAIQNPKNLRTQVEGCVLMGLGAILKEETKFENGVIQNTSFKSYEVPRFKDIPPLEVVLIDRPDIPSAGAGEAPIIAVAPAVANAISQVVKKPITRLPLRWT